MKYLVVFLMFAASAGAQHKAFLSNLSATKNSPLYTTYAAAMERSEFALDEGYHFLFYDPARGAEFTTDNAGDWALAFRMGTQYVYALNEMAHEPVITVSYPDLVKYHFYPYELLRTDVTFMTYSSRIAIQDVVVSNERTTAASFDLLPFFQNHDRAFSNVRFMKDKNAVSFSHEEFPDDWVTSQDFWSPNQLNWSSYDELTLWTKVSDLAGKERIDQITLWDLSGRATRYNLPSPTTTDWGQVVIPFSSFVPDNQPFNFGEVKAIQIKFTTWDTRAPGTGSVWLDNMQVAAIPEPSIVALVSLGLGSLLVIRRKT